jgi:hypothetical protein
MDKRPLPHFLEAFKNSNGRIKESHSDRSVIFTECKAEKTEDEERGPDREFQISSIDMARGVYIFRCVICNNKIKISA